MSRKPNNLINEKSPYLQQHAYNPVNWHAWNENTLQKAKKENKCIFLSIGYSTCHWCHVMERESFEDENVAKLLNLGFIPVKVDREERPDIDAMYMDVCMLMTGGGGWPLNLLLTPDKKPFFAATYIPRENSYGRPGLKEILLQIIDLWNNSPNEILDSADKAMNAVLSAVEIKPEAEKIDTKIIERAYEIMRSVYDKENAGFGKKPKFPSAHNLIFLLQTGYTREFTHSAGMVVNTLDKMSKGGLYDQLGGGFHRYSTDEKWILPHFEKMLYDQALLIEAYSKAYLVNKEQFIKNTVYETLNFLNREMLDKQTGAFYSAIDADSEGVEGAFYVWESGEIDNILGEQEATLFKRIFNVKDEGNFLEESTGEQTGKNVLYRTTEMEQIAGEHGFSVDELNNKVKQMKKTLFEHRNKREHPFIDDKILTDWNGLIIRAFSIAGKVFNNNDFIETAKKCAGFFLENALKKDGTLYHRYKDGEWAIDGFLDDYAFFISGLCALYESSFDADFLSSAVDLAEVLVKHFEDKQSGGFYLSPNYNDELPVNKKEYFDGAYPSGNAMAAEALFTLSRLTGNTEYPPVIERVINSAGSIINQRPAGFSKTLSTFDKIQSGFSEIVIVSENNNLENNAFIKELNKKYNPCKCVIFKNPGNSVLLGTIAPFTKEMKTINGKDTCYVCKNNSCHEPVTGIEEMNKILFKK